MLGVRQDLNPNDPHENISFLFHIDGGLHEVEIFRDGFTYAGKFYKRAGLSALRRFLEVP
ncbi:MAG: hypothetical protein ACOY9Y_07630 [Bacillota bacterium]